MIKEFKKRKIIGDTVDDALVSYIKKTGGIVATIDGELKMRIKNSGGTIISVSNDKIILEPRKI